MYMRPNNRIFKKALCAVAAFGLMATKAPAQLSTNPDKFLGNITTSYQIDYGSEKFYQLWNQITPENESKWDQIEGSRRGSFNWTNCDRIYNYAKQHKFPFKFHTLVWGSQYPKWMDNLSKAEQLKAITEWMDAIKKKYPDLQMIDVVNEAIAGHAPAPYKEALGGDGVTGYDWIIRAFEMAYERWPDAILIYNDYNTFQWNTDQFIDLVRTLRDAGAPIDAYGCQSHDLTDCNVTTFKNSMVKIQNALKMPMYSTEYDIGTADDALQLQRYKEQIPYMWEADYCAGVTLWGYIYGKTWTTDGNSGLIRDGKDRPAMTWLREYMQTDKARTAKSPFPGGVKEASIYVKPASLTATKGEPLPVTVRARMKTKQIDHVDLYVGTKLVQTMTEAPYETEYTPTTTGLQTLKAVVTTTDGTKYERLSRFTAYNARSPFKGSIALPGTLQFENFDKGGEGLTYHDSDTQNEGGASYRTDAPGVDIVTCSGGYALGYTAAGEWLEYTVDVTQAGEYSFEAYAASGTTGSGFSISLKKDGGYVSLAKVSVPQTDDGQWSSYQAVKGTFSTRLDEGQHILRITIDSPYCNLDRLVLKCTSADEPKPSEGDPNFLVYLCFGQSNMEGNAKPEAIDMVGDSRFQMLATCNFDNPKRTLGQWYTATPPIVSPAGGLGMADYFGRTMIEHLPDAQVGVVAVAMGGSPIEMFDKDLYAQKLAQNPNEWWATLAKNYYGGNPYQRIIDMAREAQKKGVIKGILLHQGCSNCGDPKWPSMVKKIYEDILSDLNLKAEDVPLFVGETERADMGGGCSSHNTVVAQVPQVVPTAHVISSAGIPGNGTDPWHFSAAGYRMFGKRYAISALHLMGIEVEDDTQDEPANGLVPGEALASVAALEGQTFAIVNEAAQRALYGTDNQNLGYDDYSAAFVATNTGYQFRAEGITVDGKKCYLLRLITPMGGEYSIWGSPGYLNSQEATGWCSFILGLNSQNGQDIKNGAVWDIQYVEGRGFSLKNVGTGLYLASNGPANSEAPVYWNLCHLKVGGTNGIETVAADQRREPVQTVYYNLRGQRVAHPGRGLYIVNGKKVFLSR